MAISTAVQRGTIVYVYNEKGSQICTVSAGSGPKDGLTGYTGSSFSVRRGTIVYTYNEKGSQLSTISAR